MSFAEDASAISNVCDCCDLDRSSINVVVSRGNPTARLMLIGEAPGATEDSMGEPFVGRSGKLLDQLLNNVGINTSKDIFFCNALKCRPPKNRRPLRKELLSALPWLSQQIKLVDPWVIILAGSTSVEAVLGKQKDSISNLRGKWQSLDGRKVMPIFHPSYLLRNPSRVDNSPRSLTLGDLLKVRNKIKERQKGYPFHSCDLERNS